MNFRALEKSIWVLENSWKTPGKLLLKKATNPVIINGNWNVTHTILLILFFQFVATSYSNIVFLFLVTFVVKIQGSFLWSDACSYLLILFRIEILTSLHLLVCMLHDTLAGRGQLLPLFFLANSIASSLSSGTPSFFKKTNLCTNVNDIFISIFNRALFLKNFVDALMSEISYQQCWCSILNSFIVVDTNELVFFMSSNVVKGRCIKLVLIIINNYWMSLSMISWIIKTKVWVICRSRRLNAADKWCAGTGTSIIPRSFVHCSLLFTPVLVSFLVLSSTAVYSFTPVSLESASVSLLG